MFSSNVLTNKYSFLASIRKTAWLKWKLSRIVKWIISWEHSLRCWSPERQSPDFQKKSFNKIAPEIRRVLFVKMTLNPSKFNVQTTLFISNSGNCTQGYYCPAGQITADPIVCPIGHFCPEHSSGPNVCPNGYYQDLTTQWECKLCPQGYYCDSSVFGIVVINDTLLCPEGFYCPPGW